MDKTEFAKRYAKFLYQGDELTCFEFELSILDVLKVIEEKGFVSKSDYIELCYLKIPFHSMMAEYEKIEHEKVTKFINEELITYNYTLKVLAYVVKVLDI